MKEKSFYFFIFFWRYEVFLKKKFDIFILDLFRMDFMICLGRFGMAYFQYQVIKKN
jgi:hypothetical protein